MRQDQPGRAPHAGKASPGRQRETAGAIDAGREHQRDTYASCLVDGALQGGALVAGGAGPHAELRGVEAEGGQRRGERGSAGRGGGEQMAAVQVHARDILRPRWLTPC